MRIDLTDIFTTLAPTPIVLTIDGHDYPVNDLTLKQVTQIAEFSKSSDAENLAFVTTLFVDAVPPPIQTLRLSIDRGPDAAWGERQRLVKETALIIAAIAMACEQAINRGPLDDAVAKVQEQLVAMRKPTDD